MSAVKFREQAVVEAKQRYNALYFKLVLHAPEISKRAKPGQFVHIRLPALAAHYLRRPISISDSRPDAGLIEVIVKILGEGTLSLSNVVEGDYLDIIGPLGKPWPELKVSEKVGMVGGGVGFPPLFYLAKKLIKTKDIFFFYGGRSGDDILEEAELMKRSSYLLVSTDDGSKGEQGLVTELFSNVLKSQKLDVVLTCGPTPMMRAVADICAQNNVRCFASLEERMGCGIGVCIGCVTQTVRGYERVCTEGPVFDTADIVWQAA